MRDAHAFKTYPQPSPFQASGAPLSPISQAQGQIKQRATIFAWARRSFRSVRECVLLLWEGGARTTRQEERLDAAQRRK